MPQLISSRHEYTEIQITTAITTTPLSEQGQPRRPVALDWIDRDVSQIALSGRLIGSATALAGR